MTGPVFTEARREGLECLAELGSARVSGKTHRPTHTIQHKIAEWLVGEGFATWQRSSWRQVLDITAAGREALA